MTIDPVDLAAQSLRVQFEQQIKDGTFPSVHGLRELKDSASKCRLLLSRDRAVVAFILEKICAGWEYDLSGRPISQAEMNTLRQKLLKLVGDAIEFLNDGHGDPLLIAADLVEAAP